MGQGEKNGALCYAKQARLPKTRKPGGSRPTAGRKPGLTKPVIITARIEAADRDWLIEVYGNMALAVRALIKAAKETTVTIETQATNSTTNHRAYAGVAPGKRRMYEMVVEKSSSSN